MAAEFITTWRLLSTSNAPSFREWSAMTWVDSLNKAVLWGGAGGGAYLNDIVAFDPAGKAWTTLDPNDSCAGNSSFGRPNGSDENGVVFDPVNNYFWIWNGGRGYTCESQPGFKRAAGTGTSTAVLVDPMLPGGTDDFYKDWLVRNAAGATAKVLSYDATQKRLQLDRDLGITAGGAYAIFADFGSGTWAYDLSTGQYTKLMARHWGYTGLEPAERRSPGFAADGVNAYMFGGASNDSALYRLNFAAKEFFLAIPSGQSSSPMPRGQIENQFVFDSLNRRFVLFGGECFDRQSLRCTNGAFLDDTWIYDPANNTWTAVTGTVRPSGRSQAQMYFDSRNGVIVLFGGVSASGAPLDDIWTFDVQTLTWSQQVTPSVNPGDLSLALSAFSPTTGCGYAVYGKSRGGAQFGIWELCLRLNNPPTAVIAPPSTTLQAGLFTTYSAAGSADTDGTIASYIWDFGDGTTGSGVSPSKVYAAPGTYTVRLTVTDSERATTTTTLQVVVTQGAYSPPVANFATQPAVGVAGVATQFSAASSTTPNTAITSYVWDFGDGTSGSGVSFNKVYPFLGSYKVTLTVTDNRGLSAVKSATFTVGAASGVATNVAASANGGVASASSAYDARFPVASVNNGDRRGLNWAAGGGWNDGTSNTWPDWVQIDFSGSQTINEIDVFTIQDNAGSPAVPTLNTTFSQNGITAYQVQYWDGAGWVNVTGGTVSGNNKVWRQFSFTPVTTSRIRVLVNNGMNGFSRIAEVEAWTPGSVTNQPPVANITGPSGGLVGANLNFSGATSTDAENAISSYAWSFGDGTTATGAAVSKSYGAAGNYSVTLTVTDAAGLSNSRTQTVVITAVGTQAINVAAAANGGVATASSAFDERFPVSAVNNGDRKGLNWAAGGGWNDATANAYPDWVQIDFGGTQTISEIDVFTVQDNPGAPSTPTLATTFSQYGMTAYQVQYWDGAAWADVPGGSVSGNNKVWRQFSFAPVTTPRIRVLATGALNSYSRIVEVEAWTPGSVTNQPPVAVISGPTGGLVGANLNFSGSGSTDSENAIASYAWTFGDGTTGTGAAVGKSYPEAGTYTVGLTVTDAGGLSSSKSQTVVITAPGTQAINVAAASNGGVASASSVYDDRFPVGAVNDGDRKGLNWAAGGGWNDATPNAFPDWVQIDFGGAQTIGEIDVFTVQDTPGAPSTPTLAMNFSQYGITAYQVQYWDGAGWVDVPGAKVSGNNKVWRQFTFAPITTARIRVLVTGAQASHSRIVEIEAWTPGSVSNQPPVASISGPGGGLVGASLTFSGAGSTDPENAIASYAWTFGDNTTGSGATVTKTFGAAGTYTVILTVTDAEGLKATRSQTVVISDAGTQAINVAAAANGGVATASSVYDDRFPVSSVNDGDRKGLNWAAGGGWNDATQNAYPDWVQIDFGGTQTIGEIDVFTVQDNAGVPSTPTLAMGFSSYGITAFQVQYWDGSAWVDVPGGNVTGNNRVWRQFSFAPISTPRIRVRVTGSLYNYSRIVEIEAWTLGN